MTDTEWILECRRLFDMAVGKIRGGVPAPDRIFTPADVALLASCGLRPIQVFDLADDFQRHGEPSADVAVSILSARREFFLRTTGDTGQSGTIPPSELPPREEEVQGIPWLPRVTAKARAFLRGRLHEDTMFGCGGDRAFFLKFGLHPVDFLRIAEAEEGDPGRIASVLLSHDGTYV